MIDLCKIFGVEEGEEFKIGIYEKPYRIYNNRIQVIDTFSEEWIESQITINYVISADIIKLPKKKEFTDDELAIMRSLPKEFEWIARDTGTDSVFAFVDKPIKYEYGNWWNEGRYCILVIFNHLFNSITSEDEEPVFIDDYVERSVQNE